MKHLNLTATNPSQELVKKYLEENVSDLLAEKINNGKKTLKGCWNYIKTEAYKTAEENCACLEHEEVFGLAIHYFEEDSIEECKTAPYAKTVTSKAKKDKPTTPPESAVKTPEKVTPPTNTPAPTKKPTEAKKPSEQISIFDLF